MVGITRCAEGGGGGRGQTWQACEVGGVRTDAVGLVHHSTCVAVQALQRPQHTRVSVLLAATAPVPVHALDEAVLVLSVELRYLRVRGGEREGALLYLKCRGWRRFLPLRYHTTY